MLSLKQKDVLIRWDLFCLGIAKGEVAGKVYLEIYDCKSMDVAYVNASRLLRNAKVQERIQELRDQIQGEGIAKIKDRYRTLTAISKDDRVGASGLPANSARISAIDIMNKMDKIYTDSTLNINAIRIEIIEEDVKRDKEEALPTALYEGIPPKE